MIVVLEIMFLAFFSRGCNHYKSIHFYKMQKYTFYMNLLAIILLFFYYIVMQYYLLLFLELFLQSLDDIK